MSDRVFDALQNPDKYEECGDCNGYGSSMDDAKNDASGKCRTCNGDGVIPKDD